MLCLFFKKKLRCFFRGNGGTVNVLRISGVQGYPECGTQRVMSHNWLFNSCRL